MLDKNILRFITCGSVDDGKSTLIGRLLYESKLILEDQLKTLSKISKKYGTTGTDIDFALLLDGLSAEREQGITIDVAYRFFSTEKRRFIVADTPGHVQYTRNMVTGASTADLAIIIVDASKGLLPQTKRHSYIVSLLGVKHIILAINKMDLINYDKTVFYQISKEYKKLVKDLNFHSLFPIPVSALSGDNFIKSPSNMPWYKNKSLMAYLESIEINDDYESNGFCMPVQWVNRQDSSFRGYTGKISAGTIRNNAAIKVLPSNKRSHVKKVIGFEKEIDTASVNQSTTITLEDELDISRGDVIVEDNDDTYKTAEQVNATLIWMSDKPLISSRQYLLQLGTNITSCIISEIKYKIDVISLNKVPTKKLTINEIGIVDLIFDQPIVVCHYKILPKLGSFIIIDKITNETLACGMINHILYRSQNIYPQNFVVSRRVRARQKKQEPKVLWLTGLPCSGKSTIANILEQKLHSMGMHTMILDGDNFRNGLSKDLGFTETDRAENIRRAAEVSKLMLDAGLIIIAAFVSPFSAERKMVKKLIGADSYVEIFVDTPIETVEQRDRHGLYKKARAGEIINFTGVSSPYEEPENPNITLKTNNCAADESADIIIGKVFK